MRKVFVQYLPQRDCLELAQGGRGGWAGSFSALNFSSEGKGRFANTEQGRRFRKYLVERSLAKIICRST